MDQRPIGVFDSGSGGLTAVREIRSILPSENIIYFGDTSRVPYGGRSAEILLRYARQDVHFLRSFDVKALLVACGTVSTNALPVLAAESDIPILGVVENMSYVLCPDCGRHIQVFGDSHVDEISAKYKVPVLAKMPIDPELAKEADAGMIEMYAGDYLDGAAQAVAKLLK